MSGRFVNYIKDLGDWEIIMQGWSDVKGTGYNVSPTQTIPVVSSNALINMRYLKDNELGVRFEPWHIKVL